MPILKDMFTVRSERRRSWLIAAGASPLSFTAFGAGLGAMGGTAASEVIRDEVRSLVGLGYWLLTGLPAEDPRIEAGRLIPRLDRRWDDWFNEGLDPLGGFATAGETLAGLPGIRRGVEGRERVGPVRTVLGRMRRALTSNT
jgi:hypothetical protein